MSASEEQTRAQSAAVLTDSQLAIVGVSLRTALATMLMDDLMLNDAVVPYQACITLVDADPVFSRVPSVRAEVDAAMRPPAIDPALQEAILKKYQQIAKLPENSGTAAKLGPNPKITVIYRDKAARPKSGMVSNFLPEIGVVRLQSGSVRSYTTFNRALDGRLFLGTGGVICVQGDTNCASPAGL